MELDRPRLEQFTEALTKMSNQLKKCFSRASDIQFGYPSEAGHRIVLSSTMSDLIVFLSSNFRNEFQSTIKVRAHLFRLWTTDKFTLDFGKQKVNPDKVGANEYNLLLGIVQDVKEDGKDQPGEEDCD